MAQTNAEYWAQRMKALEEALLERSYAYVENMERQFALAQKEIERDISAWYARFAANNGITLAEAKRLLNTRELQEFRWTVEEYIRHGRENALNGIWKKQLENASARVHISRLESLKLQIQQQAEVLYGNQLDALDAALRHSYENGYYGTAFEIQRRAGVGHTMAALDTRRMEKVLSRPWTADGQTFRDRCWTNKQALVNSVNTQMTQMIIRGEVPDKAIRAISHQFDVSRTKAGRLVMTESAAFASAAQKDCYADLGVERYEIVTALDGHVCEHCGALDGKVFRLTDFAPGQTAHPFHPWCRCTTVPYYEDMAGLGERFARDADGKAVMVPADMTYAEWKKAFVGSGEKEDLLAIFQPVSDYRRPDGSFDIEAAVEDYKKSLSSVPEKYRIYLEQSVDAVEYKETDNPKIVFGYYHEDGEDVFLYNPRHPSFFTYDFRLAATHELAHRIDWFHVQSGTSHSFTDAIQKSNAILDKNPQLFISFCKDHDQDGFLSDIMSAICKEKYEFPAQHGPDYWEKPQKQEREIFSNLFSLNSYRDQEKLDFLTEHFPDLIHCFETFEYLVV